MGGGQNGWQMMGSGLFLNSRVLGGAQNGWQMMGYGLFLNSRILDGAQKWFDRWVIQCTWKFRMWFLQSTKFWFEEESTQLLTTELQSEFDCQFVSSKSHTLFVANQVLEWIDFARGC